ncbi:MAG TPA: selenocysteine synthase, partial [Flavihumibacter sp.]|nr:selenocysteine synthase [Flavihumibacter sp.]
IDGVTTTIKVPPIANHTPTLHVTWDKSKINLTNDEFMDRLRKGNPSIEVVSNAEGGFNTTVFMLKPGEEKIVAKRFKEELLNTK